jgi:hypothetical protein
MHQKESSNPEQSLTNIPNKAMSPDTGEHTISTMENHAELLSQEINDEQAPQAEITKNTEESQLSYLRRTGDLITQKLKTARGILFDPARAQEQDLPTDIQTMIENIMIEALDPQKNNFDLSKNEATIARIEKRISYHDKGTLTDSASFDETERSRKFFEIQPGKGASKRETYWNTLFFTYNTKSTREFAQKILTNKNIVLLGGGRSRLGEELREHNIIPHQLVNADPFVENVEEGADTVIPLSASDENFIQKMHAQGIKSADEIWAEYSVPAYLENPKEIKQLFQNIHELLAPGGSARIWPIQVGGRGTESDLSARKNALMESLRDISSTQKYEIISYESAGRTGILLHKLMPSENDLQETEDKEKIQQAREKIKALP